VDQIPGAPVGALHASGELLWGVGAVATRLGIAGPTLRTWDRRYGLGPSRRTDGGHRRYTDTDVARLALMSRLTDEGVPAAQAAIVALTRDAHELQPRSRRIPSPVAQWPSRGASDSSEALVRAAADLDAATLSRVSAQVLQRNGVVTGWTHVLVPALREIGRRWSAGELGIEVEHLMSERLGAELRAVIRARRVHRVAAAKVLMASAEDEQHQLPLLALEAALAERRISSVTLGARTPPGPLAAAVERRTPTAVFVWATMPRTNADVVALAAVGGLGPQHVLLGGPGWDGVTIDADPGIMSRVFDLAAAVARIEALVRH